MTPHIQRLSVRIFEALTPFCIVIIFAAVFVSSFYYIIQPELQKYWSGGPLNVATVQELLNSRKTYQHDLKGLFTFYKGTTQTLDPLTMILPSSKDVPTLYALFEKIGKDTAVGLQVIDIASNGEQQKNTKGQIQKVQIALRFVNVDYDALKRVIVALESNIRLTSIESYSFDPVNHIASFTVATYYFSDGVNH